MTPSFDLEPVSTLGTNKSEHVTEHVFLVVDTSKDSSQQDTNIERSVLQKTCLAVYKKLLSNKKLVFQTT